MDAKMSVRKAGFARKIRLLTHVVILSTALNSIFFILFFYFLIRTTPFISHFEYEQPNEEPAYAKKFTNTEVLKRLACLNHPALVVELMNKELIEDGYQIRDLALALLVRRDHFDLPRALGKRGIAIRWVQIGTRKLALFPGLMEEDYKKIEKFLQEEKWPLTPRGLFLALKKRHNDPSLMQACSQTNEFLNVWMLFKDVKVVKKKWILSLLQEGKWESLEKFVCEQKSKLDLTPERRCKLLLSYLHQGSKTAASLLLLTDFEACLKRFDDASVSLLLDRLPMTSKRGELFAKRLLESPRSDSVHERARKRCPIQRPQGG